MNKISLTPISPTDLSQLKINSGLIDRIEIEGTGSLSVCTLTFFNGDEESADQYQTIIFSKTDHPSQYILTPHKQINISDYSYCSLKVFSGNLHPDDKVLLFYGNPKTIEKLP